MTDADQVSPKEAGGALADALTLARILITPVIMALIIFYWPDTQMAVFASVLFIVAALTDIFDDFFGGDSQSTYRKFGWVDDVADTVLIVGCLIALSIVLFRAKMFAWPFAIPALIIIGRELGVGLVKGYELSRFGWPDTKLSNAKSGLSMLAVCILVASPWLTQALDKMRANRVDPVEVFDAASPWIWIGGQTILWIAAVLSIITAIQIFRTPLQANDA